jgi:Tfp pilus assembly protein PilV
MIGLVLLLMAILSLISQIKKAVLRAEWSQRDIHATIISLHEERTIK